MLRFSLTFVLLAAVNFVGCKSSDFDISPVSGRVTLNGDPLPNARLVFNPRAKEGSVRAGPDSFGKTDENGEFRLKTIDSFDGAVVTTHRVFIRTIEFSDDENVSEDAPPTRKELLPGRYHDRTELTFDVPATGTDQANFELTSP